MACVWSCSPRTAAHYPAVYLFRFLDHHGMLSVGGSPTWRTVTGGSRVYVERIVKRLTAIRTATPVRALRRHADGADVVTDDGETETYDAVVVATHPDQALRLLADPTAEERRVLGAIPYSSNPTLLHRHHAAAPQPRRPRLVELPHAHLRPRPRRGPRQLRHEPPPAAGHPERYVVTLGEEERVDPARVLARMVYEHPVYTPASLAARRRLPALATPVTAFAGAYHGWGFHEDGCRSGAEAARHLGARW